MTEHDKALEAAAKVLNDHGIDMRLPWEGTLDDREREVFEGFCAAITAYHAGQGDSEIAEIIELALNECVGRSKVTPSILTGRGRKEIAGIAASVVLTRLTAKAAEAERLRAALASILDTGTRKAISLPSGDTYDTLSSEAEIARAALEQSHDR